MRTQYSSPILIRSSEITDSGSDTRNLKEHARLHPTGFFSFIHTYTSFYDFRFVKFSYFRLLTILLLSKIQKLYWKMRTTIIYIGKYYLSLPNENVRFCHYNKFYTQIAEVIALYCKRDF